MPFQDAVANNVLKTKDLENVPTDLYMLPLAENQPMTISETVNAIAAGYVFFDDGLTALPAPYAKFEIYLKKESAGDYAMTFKNTGNMKKGYGKKNEMIGDIKIFWASKSGMDKVGKAVVATSDDYVTVDTVFDENTQVLTLSLKDKNISFWDITNIDLQ